VSIDCSTVLIALQEIEDIVHEREVDPALLGLIRHGAYDEALERIESLTVSRSNNSSAYLAIAASLLTIQGAPAEAVPYARRAYEMASNDAVMALRYYVALAIAGRRDEAVAFLAAAYRRRSQFSGSGPSLIEAIRLEETYSPSILAIWLRARELCSPTNPGNPGGNSCLLDATATANVNGLRTQIRRIIHELSDSGVDPRVSLQLAYEFHHYELLCDIILEDSSAAQQAERSMREVADRIRSRFGPWVVLTMMTADSQLDTITPAPYRRDGNALFDQALREATETPIASLASAPGDEHILRRFSGLMVAGFRLSRMGTLLASDPSAAWRTLASAVEESRRYGNAPLAIQIRLASVYAMAVLIGPRATSFDTDFVRTEFVSLRRSFVQDPRLWIPLQVLFNNVSDSVCRLHILSSEECNPDNYPAPESPDEAS
jgi:tetratricopeptide (TPR) repeat protein